MTLVDVDLLLGATVSRLMTRMTLLHLRLACRVKAEDFVDVGHCTRSAYHMWPTFPWHVYTHLWMEMFGYLWLVLH